MNNKGFRKLSAISFLLLAAVAAYSSSPGSLDLSLAGTGYKYDGFGGGTDEANATAIQADGKIVVAGYTSKSASVGDVAIARYNTDGSLDTTFNGGGKVITPVVSDDDRATSVAIQADGKIVVAGYAKTGANYDFLVLRYTTNGTLDSTFHGDGKVITPISQNDYAWSVAIQPDGRIVAAGYSSFNTTSVEGSIVVRYNSDGTLDTSFEGDGIVTTFLPSTRFTTSAMKLQPDGKIVTAGTFNTAGPSDLALARYNPDGSLDTSFSGDGIVITSISSFQDNASAIALQPDGKIVAAGSTFFDNVQFDGAFVRYNTDGTLDTTFSDDGIVKHSFQSGHDFVFAVAVQADGKIVGAGMTQGFPPLFSVMRLNSDGSLDNSFAGDGRAVNPFGVPSISRAVAIQPDGKMVAAGFAVGANSREDFAVIRYNPDGSQDTGFDADGLLTSDIGNGPSTGRGVVVQPNGKIVALGTTLQAGADNSIGLTRSNQDGSPDTSFGVGGKVSAFPACSPQDLILQPDGKIVVVGSSGIENNRRFLTVRYNANGSLDTSFGTNGFVVTPIPGTTFGAGNSLALQPDGKIVVLGYGFISSAVTGHLAMVRYNPDGSLDTSFDGDGVVTTPSLPGTNHRSVAIQPDGKIVAGGSNGTASSTEMFAVSRYNSDGSLDNSFDGDGIVTTAMLAGGGSYVTSLEPLTDGRIVAGGRTSNGSNTFFAVARYNLDGSLDPSFDSDGIAVTQVLSQDSLRRLEIQADGKIVAAGDTYNGSNLDMAFVRYNFDGSLDLGYGTGGKAVIDLGTDENVLDLALDSGQRAVVVGHRASDLLIARIHSGLVSQQVDVGGQITSTNGQGISGAIVVITDANNSRRTARTNAFGMYVFSGVSTLESYVVSVSSKRYRFQPPSQTITVTGSVMDVDFVGNPGSESKNTVTLEEKITTKLGETGHKIVESLPF